MLAVALAALLALPAAAQDNPEKELQAVREKIAELQRNVRRDTDRRDKLSSQLRDAGRSPCTKA